jgi:hypothetical protein
MRTGVGALARVSRAIEYVGGTISSVDLQSSNDGIGICDLSVRLDAGVASLDTIGDALRETGGGVVSEMTPIDESVDPVLRAIRWACSLVGAGRLADDELRRVMSEICSTPDTWFLSLEEAERIDVAAEAARTWAPAVETLSVAPSNVEASFTGPAALLAVPDARLEPTGVALIVRPASYLFSQTEIDRVEAVLALRRRSALLDGNTDEIDDGYDNWFDVSNL